MSVAMATLSLSANAGGEEPPANLAIMKELAGTLAGTIAGDCASAGFDTVAVSVVPPDPGWLIEGAILEGLQSGKISVVAGVDTTDNLTISIQNLGVDYSNLRGAGLFGGTQVDRHVNIQLGIIARPARSGGTLFTRTYEKQMADTIMTSDVPSVENSALPVTVGRVPESGFFSNLAEPFIVIGALAVGVYLLFAVRS
jgi:hypothetical protein